MLRKLPSPGPPLGQKLPSPSPYPPMWGEDLPPASLALAPSLPDVVPPLPPSEPVFTLQDASDLLRAKALELLDAGPARVSQLNIDIQKLRVLCMVLREVELGVSDPNTYKELNLLNKMLTGKDMEADENRQTAEEEASATAALESRGIKAESASRMMRALTSIMLDKATVLPDDDDEPPDPGEGK